MAVPLGPTIKSIPLEIKLIDLLTGQILVIVGHVRLIMCGTYDHVIHFTWSNRDGF